MQPLNLMPDLKTQRQERLRLSLPRIAATVVAVWLLLLGSAYGVTFWQQRQLTARTQEVNVEIAELEPVAQRVAQLQELTQAVAGLQELLAHNTQGIVIPTLDLVATLMPSEVRAEQITFEQGRVSLICSSSAMSPIGQLYTNLQQAQQFRSVQFSAINSIGANSYGFSVTLELQEAKAHE